MLIFCIKHNLCFLTLHSYFSGSFVLEMDIVGADMGVSIVWVLAKGAETCHTIK